MARRSLDALLAVTPTTLLGVSELFIDRHVLIYAFGVSLATGAVAGLVPTILFARRSMADALRTRGRPVTRLVCDRRLSSGKSP